jgi:hypothetical protein
MSLKPLSDRQRTPSDGKSSLYLWQGELIKTEKFTGPNKVLLVFDWRTGSHRKDCE